MHGAKLWSIIQKNVFKYDHISVATCTVHSRNCSKRHWLQRHNSILRFKFFGQRNRKWSNVKGVWILLRALCLNGWKEENKPAECGWRVGCDDEQSSHLQRRRPDHGHSHTGRPKVINCERQNKPGGLAAERRLTGSIRTVKWRIGSSSFIWFSLINNPRTRLRQICVPRRSKFGINFLSPSWFCTSISDSGLSLECLGLEYDEWDEADSRSSFSDSVISPSSGSLLPSDSSLRATLLFFFFLCFSDLDFFLFFLELPLSSWWEPFFNRFFLDGDLSLSFPCFEESFLLLAKSGLRDLRCSFRDSARSVSSVSNFASSSLCSCHQTVSSEITASKGSGTADFLPLIPDLSHRTLIHGSQSLKCSYWYPHFFRS